MKKELITIPEDGETAVVWRTEFQDRDKVIVLQGIDCVPMGCEVRRIVLPLGCGQVVRYITKIKNPSILI